MQDLTEQIIKSSSVSLFEPRYVLLNLTRIEKAHNGCEYSKVIVQLDIIEIKKYGETAWLTIDFHGNLHCKILLLHIVRYKGLFIVRNKDLLKHKLFSN